MYCIQCQYDLRSLADSRCPECGRTFDAADPATYWPSPDGPPGSRMFQFLPTAKGWIVIGLILLLGVLPPALMVTTRSSRPMPAPSPSILDWIVVCGSIAATLIACAIAARTSNLPNRSCAAVGIVIALWTAWTFLTYARLI